MAAAAAAAAAHDAAAAELRLRRLEMRIDQLEAQTRGLAALHHELEKRQPAPGPRGALARRRAAGRAA